MGSSRAGPRPGAFVTDEEIHAIIALLQGATPTSYRDDVTAPAAAKKDVEEDIGDDMEVFLAAVELVVSTQFGRRRCCSASCGSASPRPVA